MYGMIATMADGGAKRQSRDKRLMKLAMVVAGRWLVGDKKVSRCRKTRDRYLLCSKSLSNNA